MKQMYGDNAVGYVQLKRTEKICTLKARITPEHKVLKTAYNVEAVIHEGQEKVISCVCKDCPASEGIYLCVLWFKVKYASSYISFFHVL